MARPREVLISVQVEATFTTALGLQAPWHIAKVELETVKRRIDFEVVSSAKRLTCPSCGAADQAVHDRIRRGWRHLDFFQFEALCAKSVQSTVIAFGRDTSPNRIGGLTQREPYDCTHPLAGVIL